MQVGARWVRCDAARPETSTKDTAESVARRTAVCTSAVRMEREDQGRGHREFARSGDADDGEGVGEGAEVDNALPRRRQLVRGLLLGLDRLGLLELGASLGLDLERAELVAPSEDVVVLQKGGGEHTLSSYCGQRSARAGDGVSWIGLTIRAPSPNHQGTLA